MGRHGENNFTPSPYHPITESTSALPRIREEK